MVLIRKRVEFPLRVENEILPQVEAFKYLGVLFTSEGRMKREIDRRIGAVSAVMRALHRPVVVKKELSQKVNRSIYVPTYELWVMTKRTRSWIQAAEIGFLRRVSGLSVRDRERSSVIRIERSQMRWLRHLVRIAPGRIPGEGTSHCEETPGKTQGILERLCLSADLGMTWGPPGRAGGSGPGQGRLGFSAQAAAPATQSPEK